MNNEERLRYPKLIYKIIRLEQILIILHKNNKKNKINQ